MHWKPFCVSFFLILSIPTASFSAENEIPVYARVPDFNFQNQKAGQTSLSDLAGRVWIADFVFTRCQNLCPLMSGRMANLQEELEPSGVKLVSFSVDPEHDSAKVLSQYADRFKAKEGTWFFLTAPKQTMWNFIEEGFQLGVAEPTDEELKNGAEPVMHSSKFVLVDQKGAIRGYYDSSEPEHMKQLTQDALKLVAKAE